MSDSRTRRRVGGTRNLRGFRPKEGPLGVPVEPSSLPRHPPAPTNYGSLREVGTTRLQVRTRPSGPDKDPRGTGVPPQTNGTDTHRYRRSSRSYLPDGGGGTEGRRRSGHVRPRGWVGQSGVESTDRRVVFGLGPSLPKTQSLECIRLRLCP